MQIHPSVSEIREISTSPDKTSTKPVIDIREIDTMVDAKAGETIVIAGLISDKLSESKRSVPLLGDIPYLGALFSYSKQDRAKTELVIMMTPYFLNARSIADIRREHELRMQNIGGDFHLINNMGSMVTEKSSRDRIMQHQIQLERTQTSTESAPAPPLTVTPPAKPSAPVAPEKQSNLGPEVKTPVEQQMITPVTPPETVQRLEQQQAEIARLENEVTPA